MNHEDRSRHTAGFPIDEENIQIMVLVSWAQLFEGEVVEVFVDDNIIKVFDN